MNTAQLKKFAQEARIKLIASIEGKLEEVLTLDSSQIRAREEVINRLKTDLEKIGKETFVEKIADVWFNRFVALRYMDANDFQPLGINIISPAAGREEGTPQILSDIQAGVFPADLELDQQYINDLLNGVSESNNIENTIFRHVLIAVCNDLHRIFPFLFERINDYSELLLPEDLTSPFSIVTDVLKNMPTEDCKEVEIIGWLYQFYISEKKDEVFASKSKIKKEDIPAATQLFTPRWIVEYMVQNTVGKLWLQNNPNSSLRTQMPYYIENPSEGNEEYLKVSTVEEIKLLDQACGSGHILVYGFELFTKIYEEQGYSPSEIPAKIIANNLFGMDIDERAAQLAAFAVTMKARAYYRRFFRKVIVPNVLCYTDVEFTPDEFEDLATDYKIQEIDAFKKDLALLSQATNLGSLIQPETSLEELLEIQKQVKTRGLPTDMFRRSAFIQLNIALDQLIVLKEKYHCVVQNPPYMGGGKYNEHLSSFVKDKYPDSKADLFSCFIERSILLTLPNGLIGNVTMESWMFLSSFENFRQKLLKECFISSLSHFGWHIMRIAFGTVAFILQNTKSKETQLGVYNYLEIDDIDKSSERPVLFPNTNRRYSIKNQKDFEKIPGSNIGYWLSEQGLYCFNNCSSETVSPKQGLATTNNNRFLRYWSEVSIQNIGMSCDSFMFLEKKYHWAPYNKGGEFRKWYGNQSYVVNWFNDGLEIKNMVRAKYRDKPYAQGFSDERWDKLIEVWVVKNIDSYFKESITWSFISSSNFGVRYSPCGFIFDVAGSSAFPNKENLEYILAFMLSKIAYKFLQILNPTMNYQVGDMSNLPILYSKDQRDILIIKSLVQQNISISKEEWNSRETSWDFEQNELIRIKHEIENEVAEEGVVVDLANANLLKVCVQSYCDYWQEQFFTLHKNEEELNRQFIDIYGLQGELTPDVPLEDITILKDETRIEADQLVFREEEIAAQLISYALGCIFGRYSVDCAGLILANQGETLEQYVERVGKSEEEWAFKPDADNVVPVLDEEWFDDDIVNRVREFIAALWGSEYLQENIQYLEKVLGKNLRKYLTKDFYKDHIKRYKKRPIYWMFSSPKAHFNVLIYMHRYTPDTLNIILNSYLRPFMEKVRSDMERQADLIVKGTAVEQGLARKRQDRLKEVLLDCEKYEYEILYPLAGDRIALDLDDGVLVNYNKFGKAIAPVAGLNDAKTKTKVRGFDWIDTTTIK